MKRLLPLRVLMPLALGVIVSLGVLGFAEIGYRRLEFANRAMSAALEMETAVNETLALVGEAESGAGAYRAFFGRAHDDFEGVAFGQRVREDHAGRCVQSDRRRTAPFRRNRSTWGRASP